MERWSKYSALLVLGAYIVLVLVLPVMAQGTSKGAPKFFTPKTEVEVGEHMEGQDVEYEFVIRNHGTEELHINSVRPG